MKKFETIWVTLRPPRDGDPGIVEEGRYRIEGDIVMLVTKDGTTRLTQKGKPIQYKLEPGQKARTIAALLVKDHLPTYRGDFNRKIEYFNPGKF